jgi:hypothetical protein
LCRSEHCRRGEGGEERRKKNAQMREEEQNGGKDAGSKSKVK